MKLLHLADLHLGKVVRGFSMLEDQRYLLRQIVETAKSEAVDVVLIAGDVYDKHFPSEEAVALLDDFLSELRTCGLRIMMIAGNHDSRVRLQFGHRLFCEEGVHIVGSLEESILPITLNDAYGPICFYLLPYVKPAYVRAFLDQEIKGYPEALDAMIAAMNIDSSRRNVLVAHQFVRGASTCDSESALESVGGLDEVSADSFDAFDYVALGHLHSPQQIQRPTLRYGGSPLKYSLSEARQKKQMVLVELRGKDDTSISFVPYRPLHDLREIKGNYDQIMQEGAADVHFDDYVHITLTDEHMIPDAKARLHTVYPHIMELRYANIRLAYQQELVQKKEAQTPLAFVEKLYELQNNQPMAQQQRSLIEELLEEIEEGL